MKKNSGFTLLELLLVIGLSTAIAVVAFQDKMLETEQSQARQLGMELFQYNSAVQNYLAHESGNKNPASLNGVKHSGVNWLKSSSTCSGGLAVKEWLACRFLQAQGGKTTFGRLSFNTTLSFSSSEGLSATTVVSPLEFNKNGTMERRGDLSGLAALVASGAYSVKDKPMAANSQDSSIVYCPETASKSPSMAAICNGRDGSIVMFSRNLSESDRWLRVDHGNVMQNTLEFRTGSTTPESLSEIQKIDSVARQIRNVARIYNLGDGNKNGENDNLYLGKRKGEFAKTAATLKNDAVVVDADQEILGKLIIQGDVQASGKILANKNIESKQNVIADINVNAKSDVIANKNVIANNDVTANNNVVANKDIHAKRNLFVDGSATITGMVDATGDVKSKNAIYGRVFKDIDNGGYYLDPSSSSYVNHIYAESIETRKEILPGLFYPGASCRWNGSIGRNAYNNGPLLCVNNLWKSNESKVGPWISYGANMSHIAPADGFIVVRSSHNGWISISVNGAERCLVSGRDKYGQGYENCSTVVAKGESFYVTGGIGYIYFRQIG
jgi:type II secretory pathway pseudopilin PulG